MMEKLMEQEAMMEEQQDQQVTFSLKHQILREMFFEKQSTFDFYL